MCVPDRWTLVNLSLFRSMLEGLRRPTPGAVIEEVSDQGGPSGPAQAAAADPAEDSRYTPSFCDGARAP